MFATTRGTTSTRRGGDRVPLALQIEIRDARGERLLDEAICTNIGLGGLCVRAPDAIAPGTRVEIALRLFSGRPFACTGHVCWSKVTLHPALFGTPKGTPEDASFGIAFDGVSTQDLLPIARLLVAREDARRRARRLRRIHGIHARA